MDKRSEIVKDSLIILGILSLTICNQILTNVILACISIYCIIRPDKANRGLILIYTISFLNPYFLKKSDSTQIIKWLGFIGICLSILYQKRQDLIRSYRSILITLSIWFAYNLVVSLIFSSYVLISLLKLLSFALGIVALKVNNNRYEQDRYWLLSYIFVVCIASMLLINSDIGYYENGIGFQGIFNQPNHMGILIPILYSIYIYIRKSDIDIPSFYNTIIIFMMIIVFKTQSRTGIITFFVLIVFTIILNFYTSLTDRQGKHKYYRGLLAILVVAVICSFIPFTPLNNIVNNILYKHGNSILYSSQAIINNNIDIIRENLLFGNGFGVDSSVNKSPEASSILSHPIEKRNIFLGIMTEGGIIGLVLFIALCYVYFKDIYTNIFDYKMLILLAILLVNQGEYIIFSMNGSGIFAWITLNFPDNRRHMIVR